MPIQHHHRGYHDGRGDDPHGVTSSNSAAMNFDPDTMGFRREGGPLEAPIGKPARHKGLPGADLDD